MGHESSAFAFLVVPVAALLVATAGAGALGCKKSFVDVPFTWESDVAAGLARAKAENKPVVVYFGATWDCAAKELEHQTWSDPQIRLLLGRELVAIHVDATDDENPNTRENAERFKVVGDPTVIILGADGRSEISRFNEFVQPERMAQALRAATKVDAVREARFEAAVRQRADEARWDEERRKADLAPHQVIVITMPDAP
ncbi:MAG: thioredoxin:protein disulfide reductase [Myxococcales bacterium]|nr:thioredoxin:protein disulfide reductase [Myxococcales bacterium]